MECEQQTQAAFYKLEFLIACSKAKTHVMTRLFLSLLLLIFTTACLAQTDSVQNLYFVRKNQAIVFGEKDYQPGKKKAFYIYRNCIYDFVLTNKKIIKALVTDIKDSAIYYTLYKYEPASGNDTDTAILYPAALKSINMNGDHPNWGYSGFSLRKRRYYFEKSASPKTFPHLIDTTYSADSSLATSYERIPYLTSEGKYNASKRIKTWFYRVTGEPVNNDIVQKIKDPVVKKWVWFTPSNANKINGLNISLQCMQLKEENLKINGVHLGADVLSAIASFYALFLLGIDNIPINMPDTINRADIQTRVSGLSLSGGGLAGDVKMNGLSINGGISVAIQTNGLVITGSQALTGEFNGMVICGLRNKAIKGRGVQIGLLNICKHLKGVQFGLWNVNSKRKLPLINWSF
jgi:hypothetical protein